MAERRMFAKSILLLGAFPELSTKAQTLYIFLNMQADDDGFVGNPKPILRQCRCTQRQLEELVDANLILMEEGMPLVISHWFIHNKQRKDRRSPTLYQKELARLGLDENGVYCLVTEGQPNGNQMATNCQPTGNQMSTNCQPNVNQLVTNCQPTGNQMSTNRQPTVNQMATQDRIGKDRIGEDRIDKERVEEDISCDPERSQNGSDSSSSLSDFEKRVLDLYKTHCQRLVPCQYLCDDTRLRIQKIKKDESLANKLEEAFKMAGETDFLCGENKDGWVASLDWLCEGDRLKRVLSGMYASYRKKVPMGATGLGDAEIEAVHLLLASD